MDENTVDILLKELDLVATFGGEKEAHRTIGMVRTHHGQRTI